jgi:hypothetical protein
LGSSLEALDGRVTWFTANTLAILSVASYGPDSWSPQLTILAEFHPQLMLAQAAF